MTGPAIIVRPDRWERVPATWVLRDALGRSVAVVHEHEPGGWVAFCWPDPNDPEQSTELHPQSSREGAQRVAVDYLRTVGVIL